MVWLLVAGGGGVGDGFKLLEGNVDDVGAGVD